MPLFRPGVFFAVCFIFPAILAMLALSTEVRPLGGITIAIIGLSSLGYYLGHLAFGRFSSDNLRREATSFTSQLIFVPKVGYRVLTTLIVGLSCLLLYYFKTLGGFPLLMGDVDLARSKMGGAMQFSSMLLKPVMVVGLTVLLLGHRVRSRRTRIDVIALSLALLFGGLLLILTGSRGHIFFVVLVALIIRWLYVPPAPITLLAAGISGGLVISLTRFLRQYLIFGSSYIDSITDAWVFGEKFTFLYPGYVTFTANYSVFDRLVETFVFENYRYHYGYNTLLPFIAPLVRGQQETLGDFQNSVWNTGFDYNLTSTILGVPFADFGPIGSIGACTILGASLAITRYWALRFKEPAVVFVYAHMLSFVVFSFYSFPMTGLHSYVYPVVSFGLFFCFLKRSDHKS